MIQIGILLMTLLVLIDGNLEKTFLSLGWKRIMMITNNNGERKDIISLSKSGFHVSAGEDLCSVEINVNHITSLDGTSTEMRTFNETSFKRVIQCGKPEPYKNLIMMTNGSLNEMRTSLARKQISRGLIGVLMPEMQLLRIIKMAFSKKVVVMPYLPTEFNFKDLELKCYNLPWSPVIEYDCQQNRCRASGTYPKIISRLGKMFNFTTLYHLDPSGKWGSTSNLGGNASSVLNTLHVGQSAFSVSWIGTYERVVSFDHITGIPVTLDLYMMDSGPMVSWDMVLMPFSFEAWACIITLVCTVVFAHKVIPSDSVIRTYMDIRYSVTLLLGIFFTVILAFYDGAMVIALTSKQPPPFEDLQDGLTHSIWLEWHLVYSKGTEDLFRGYYEQIPGGKEKADLILNPDYKYASNSREERFQHLTNSKTFLLEDRDRASYFLRNTKCQICKNTFRFGRPETKNSGFLFEKNSPLREVFKLGMIHMRQMGLLDNIRQSLGPAYKPIAVQSASPITMQFIGLLFLFLISSVTLICPTILIIEYLCDWITSKYTLNEDWSSCKRIYEEGTCHHCGLQQIRLRCMRRIVVRESVQSTN